MLISRDETTALTIRAVGDGSIRVGDETLTGNVALTSEKIIRDWPDTPVAEMDKADLERLLREKPELIVLGTGSTQQFPPKELVFALARRGIGLETMDTAAACRTFNILVAEGRRPAALLLVD